MNRVKFISWAVISLFLFLLFGLLDLEVIQTKKYLRLGDKNCIRLLAQSGCRGKILDRAGNVIVDSKLSYDLMILPQEGEGQDKIMLAASRILDKSVGDLKISYKKNFISGSMPIVIARNIGTKQAIALEELKIEFPSIIIQPNPLRHYPYSKLACHVLGYVSEIDRWRLTRLKDYGYKTKDIVGFGGVEEKYDYYLRQEEGGLSFEVDHRGRLMRQLGFQPPVNGKDIQLTLDLKIQKIIEDKLDYRKGAIVIMDPYTGEVMAMVSSPGFDPGVFAEKQNSVIAELFNNSSAPLMNRAISSAYPAGSVFKVVVAAGGLESKKINSNTSFICRGSLLVGRKEFACWSIHDSQNLIAAITHSCNTFFYKTGLLLGGQSIHDYALKFGFSRPSGLELSHEVSGFIPSPLQRKINQFRNWYEGDTANLSIGQGDVSVTPLQITRMMAVFANDGYLVTPYIIKTIDGRDVSMYQKRIEKISIKPETIEQIKEGLRYVVSSPTGTGNVLSSLNISVAGKTGTAQAPPSQPHAWFAGFFPFEKPKYVICVFLEHGGPGYVSCVAAKQIIEEMINQGLI
ncbi:MAG: penicillin-binding protein 2 [Candidatus Omnitrophica bacterium]|nr:penicillin-binding protein 2 [Candidatus Omnitrophota bacterium]